MELVLRSGERRVEYALNLSGSGIALHLLRPLPAGELVQLAFALPDGGGRIEARGRVAWTEAAPRSERPRFREVGIRFELLREPDRRRLVRFVATGAAG